MASESLTPSPASSGGGYAKYVIALLVLLGGGLGLFLATRKPEPPQPPAVTPPPKNAERSTALTQDAIQLPVDEEPDAGAPVAEVVEEPKKPKRTGTTDSWSCEGDIPAAEIRSVLEERAPQIRACYEKRLRVNNLLQGSLRLQVRVGNDGKVTAARTSGTLKDPEVSSCIQALARKWSFPPPTGGNCAVFDAPYNFTPKP